MANEEPEINQSSETPTEVTDALASHTSDDITTQSPAAVEADGSASESPEAAAPATTDEQPQAIDSEDTSLSLTDAAPTNEADVSATDAPAAESQDGQQAALESIVETTDAPATTASDVDAPVAELDSDVAEVPAAGVPAVEQPIAQLETPAADAPELIEQPTADESEPAVEASPSVIEGLTTEDPAGSDDITAQYADMDTAAEESANMDMADVDTADVDTADVDAADVDAADDEPTAQPATDYSQYAKQDFVNLLEAQMTTVSATSVTPADFKKADQILKESKPLFDQLRRTERETALGTYVAETGSEEGFDFKSDDTVERFNDLYKQIKSLKNTYFQNLDKAKDGNFSAKTDLLTRLRVLVEADESNAADPKASWNEFKKIQDEWKAAGNMNSPHNATLWATYHALVDRYYSNRNIYFELKELDRKRNTGLKTEVIEKVEAMAKASEESPVTRQTIDEANALFEEYKHIGPAPKAEQEVLWGRMKAALDVLYDKRRGQTNEQRKESAQVYEEKSAIYEELVPLTSFTSNSINDWNDKTKAVMALQDRWNGIKGPMPREEGKELSKKFWAALKTFFHNKGEFFKQLEGKREENLRAKTELCEQVEAILASGEESAEVTQTVIELQRQWKNIGQVPEKQKNSIFDRFKAACDAFFNKKRSKNQDTEREFEENLTKKIALIERIEAAATSNADLSQLNEFKQEWNGIGFVPKKDKESIQKRYINAVNALVGSTGKIPAKDKERIMLQSEAEATRSGPPRNGGTRSGGRDRDRGDRNDRGGDFNRGNDFNRGGGEYNRVDRDSPGNKRENDIRRRITAIENDIATYRNNIEFFARSKNADKLRAEIDQKIADAEGQLVDLRHQLKVAQA